MAFGVKRAELHKWKETVKAGEIAILTHFWLDERFPGCDTVTKVGCKDIKKLSRWGSQYGLKPEWIHRDPRFPHYDLFGERQFDILAKEGKWDQIERFNLKQK
ncbi:hypothetical protein [Halobacillus sp. BBL2006]|uniref:hypothetical protein n=1 Tax=Halobacillus sp. BBL2006 TaxID=1543706 RepID=UPI000543A626|nr:hypothetical protein [Halobacillus sp. BBL2006]KHE67016.1 hypothetical protein LD39_19730 [Halobacillus sp. BBL2006]